MAIENTSPLSKSLPLRQRYPANVAMGRHYKRARPKWKWTPYQSRNSHYRSQRPSFPSLVLSKSPSSHVQSITVVARKQTFQQSPPSPANRLIADQLQLSVTDRSTAALQAILKDQPRWVPASKATFDTEARHSFDVPVARRTQTKPLSAQQRAYHTTFTVGPLFLVSPCTVRG